MNSKKKRRGQMSEAFCTAMFLSLSGGLQDVYTYLFRGKVFANAQTGNIVLMAVHAFAGKPQISFLIQQAGDLAVFSCGISYHISVQQVGKHAVAYDQELFLSFRKLMKPVQGLSLIHI